MGPAWLRAACISALMACSYGCDVTVPEGTFRCSDSERCPDGQACDPDGLCRSPSAIARDPRTRDAETPERVDGSVDGSTWLDGSSPGTTTTIDPALPGETDGAAEDAVDGGDGPSCTAEAVRCHAEGTRLERCAPSGEWTEAGQCEHGCDDGACLPACKSDEERCDEGRFMRCDAQGRWQSATPETEGIYVLAGVQARPDCGSATAPCATLAQGVARAISTKLRTLYIGSGEYPESLELPAGLRLIGGWKTIDGRWTRHCPGDRAKVATIASPANVGVRAEYDGASALESLRVVTRAAMEAESLFGIFVRGEATELTLSDVEIAVPSGGDGAAGAPGQNAPAAGETCDLPGDGTRGSTPTPAPGGTGTFDRDGYQPGHGADGLPGNPGSNGVAGGEVCDDCSALVTQQLGQSPADVSPDRSCGVAGSPGCRGEAGLPGGSGRGGGSSVALFIWDARVRVQAGDFNAGDGGDGGAGGPGGTGGDGKPGGRGAPGPTCTGVFLSGSSPSFHMVSGPAGSEGGPGGSGSNGGEGGGGSGGSSYAIFIGGAGTVDIVEEPRLAHGQSGLSLGNAASGGAAPRFP